MSRNRLSKPRPRCIAGHVQATDWTEDDVCGLCRAYEIKRQADVAERILEKRSLVDIKSRPAPVIMQVRFLDTGRIQAYSATPRWKR